MSLPVSESEITGAYGTSIAQIVRGLDLSPSPIKLTAEIEIVYAVPATVPWLNTYVSTSDFTVSIKLSPL